MRVPLSGLLGGLWRGFIVRQSAVIPSAGGQRGHVRDGMEAMKSFLKPTDAS
jgi:hypothetical protein